MNFATSKFENPFWLKQSDQFYKGMYSLEFKRFMLLYNYNSEKSLKSYSQYSKALTQFSKIIKKEIESVNSTIKELEQKKAQNQSFMPSFINGDQSQAYDKYIQASIRQDKFEGADEKVKGLLEKFESGLEFQVFQSKQMSDYLAKQNDVVGKILINLQAKLLSPEQDSSLSFSEDPLDSIEKTTLYMKQKLDDSINELYISTLSKNQIYNYILDKNIIRIITEKRSQSNSVGWRNLKNAIPNFIWSSNKKQEESMVFDQLLTSPEEGFKEYVSQHEMSRFEFLQNLTEKNLNSSPKPGSQQQVSYFNSLKQNFLETWKNMFSSSPQEEQKLQTPRRPTTVLQEDHLLQSESSIIFSPQNEPNGRCFNNTSRLETSISSASFAFNKENSLKNKQKGLPKKAPAKKRMDWSMHRQSFATKY